MPQPQEMQGYFVKKIGQNRGAPRIWLEGQQAARAGFQPGDKFDIEVSDRTIILKACKDGSRTVSFKQKGDKINPVIDINSATLLKVFEGMDAVRVVVRKDEVYLIPLASELKKQERFDRIRKKIEGGEALVMGSLSHGGGILSNAIHEGLSQAGVSATVAFVNDIREELIEHSANANNVVGSSTVLLAAPMQELAQDDRALGQLPKVDILEAGIPCSGASVPGRTRRGLDVPEAHPEVGHLVHSALVIMNRVQPAVVLIENVPSYSNTASAHILRWQLRDMGYQTHEAILRGQDFGCLEHRERWCLVATTKGLDFSFDSLQPKVAVVQKLGDFLDDVPPDSPTWSKMEGLKARRVRHEAAGHRFLMQVFGPESVKIATITKGYSKVRSTDPKIAHPTDPDLLRQLTPAEHARIKQVPERLIAGVSATLAHEILGQGIVYEPFVEVGRRIAESLKNVTQSPGVQGARPSTSRKMPGVG